MLNKATSPLLIVVPVPRLQNLGEEIHNAEVNMFVNGLSEVDVILSKVNVLMSEVNVKLSRCPPESRKVVLSRLSNILFELKWSVSLSQESSSDGDDEESSDEESLSWDSGEDYNVYREDEDDADADDENDDHGPIIFSDSAEDELSPPPSILSSSDDDNFNQTPSRRKLTQEEIRNLRPPKLGPLVPVTSSSSDEDDNEKVVEAVPGFTREDVSGKFVNEISAKINLLAPDSIYKVVRPLKYTIDLSKVNVRFLQNLPKPFCYPIHGCSEDPNFYDHSYIKKYREENKKCFYDEMPFEGKCGYRTDVGIVSMPEEPIFGYVWKDSQWTLQAQVDTGGPASRGSWSPPRKRGRLYS